jgi:hypothetical protein
MWYGPLLLVWIDAVGFLGHHDDGLGMVQIGVDCWFGWESMGDTGVSRSCIPEELGFCQMEGTRRGYHGSHTLPEWDVRWASV